MARVSFLQVIFISFVVTTKKNEMPFLDIIFQEEALAESFLKFTDYGLLLLKNHRIMFPPRNKQAMVKLEYLLR